MNKHLTVKELANKLLCKPRWIYNKVIANEIPFYKIDGKLSFDENEIEEWRKGFKHDV